MTDTPSPSTPAPMEGHGAYNRSSRVQAAGLSPALPLLEQAARIVPLTIGPEPIVIADYGSSEGRNSLAPMALAIGALRERAGVERAISVVHTDLPGSDFSQLFQTLETDPGSYLQDGAPTFAAAVGRSYFRQILPSNSVTLGWSSWSVQWLSRVPAPIPDHVYSAYSKDQSAQAAYSRQAAEDWQAFLASRGEELRPDGRLIVVTVATDDDGEAGYRPVLEAIWGAITDLAGEGFLKPEEARRMALPIVGRSRAEFMAPFTQDGRFADLSIEHIDLFHGPDPIWSDFERDREAERYGARWADFALAAAIPTLALALDGGRDDPRAQPYHARMAALMARRLAAAPEPTIIPLARLVLRKESDLPG